MTTEERKPRRPRVEGVLLALSEGCYDASLTALEEAITERREQLKEDLQVLVQEALGPDFTIAHKSKPQPVYQNRNLTPDEILPQHFKLAGGGTASSGTNLSEIKVGNDEEIIRAERLALEDDPLTEDDESRSPIFGSIDAID